MSPDEATPGTVCWWVERGADRRPVHLTLVRVIRAVEWAPGIYVKSVRSGKTYNAEFGDLLPHKAVKT